MIYIRFTLIAICLGLSSCFAVGESDKATMTETDSTRLNQFEQNLRLYLKAHEVRFENQIINELLLKELKDGWVVLAGKPHDAGRSFSKGRWTVTLVGDRAEGRFSIKADFERGAFVDYEIWLRSASKVEVLREELSMN